METQETKRNSYIRIPIILGLGVLAFFITQNLCQKYIKPVPDTPTDYDLALFRCLENKAKGFESIWGKVTNEVYACNTFSGTKGDSEYIDQEFYPPLYENHSVWCNVYDNKPRCVHSGQNGEPILTTKEKFVEVYESVFKKQY